jgi:FOG: WD40 repeat
MKFSKENPDILLTGSWDQTVKVWDIRAGKVVKSIFGVKVYGDCLDIKDNVILMGNYREEDQLQIWDLGTKKLIQNIAWDPRYKVAKGAFLTAAQFSKSSSKYILAAAAKLNEIRLFDRNDNNKLCYIEMTRENVYSVDFSNTCDDFIHGGDGTSLVQSVIV